MSEVTDLAENDSHETVIRPRDSKRDASVLIPRVKPGDAWVGMKHDGRLNCHLQCVACQHIEAISLLEDSGESGTLKVRCPNGQRDIASTGWFREVVPTPRAASAHGR
jgi:hypothetical protein